MFNLLPENLKKEIKSNYRFRLVVIALLLLIFLECTTVIFMTPALISSYYRQKDTSSQTQKMNQNLSSSDIASIDSQIKTINSRLKVLNSALNYPTIIPYVNLILDQKTNAIKLNGIIFSWNNSVATISLNGVSSTRDSLLAFVKVLQATGKFKNVDLPISSFAKDKNINFSLNLVLNS